MEDGIWLEAPKRRSVPPTCLRWYSGTESQAKNKGGVTRKEPDETQDYVSCQDVQFDGNRNLEELGMVPSSVDEPLRIKHLCDGRCDEIGFKFYDLACHLN